MPRPGHLMPGNGPAPTVPEVGHGPQSWSGQVWKILPLLGFDPQTIQPVASHNIDYVIPSHRYRETHDNRKCILEDCCFMALRNIFEAQ